MKELEHKTIEKDMFSCKSKIIVELENKETKKDIYDRYDVGWRCNHSHDCCGCYGWNVYKLKRIGIKKYSFEYYGRANV